MFEEIVRDLPGVPEFRRWIYRDVNPMSGRVKRRVLYAPNPAMKVLHRRLVKMLRRMPGFRFYLRNHATGATKGSSPRLNVERHRKNRYFYLTDITGAYGAVDAGELAKILGTLDPEWRGPYYRIGGSSSGKLAIEMIEPETAGILDFLRRFCFAPEGGLNTGSPSSPDLFNLYAGRRVDEALSIWCVINDITYTRYLDDLTFSAREPIGKRKRRLIREVVERAGFEVSHHKSRILDLAQAPITINGIGLEFGGRVFLPRWYLRETIVLIRRARRERDTALLAKVDGRMGMFWEATGRRNFLQLNRTEQRLVEEYWSLCRLLRGKEPKRGKVSPGTYRRSHF